MARRNKHRSRLTPDDRARFARDRRALVGSLLTQEGFEGALVTRLKLCKFANMISMQDSRN